MSNYIADHEACIDLLREAFKRTVFSTSEAMVALAATAAQQTEIMDALFNEAKRIERRITLVGDDRQRGFLFQFNA